MPLSITLTRINRNIVECKDVYDFAVTLVLPVLIETLWNVKVDTRIVVRIDFLCINRNIVECKD